MTFLHLSFAPPSFLHRPSTLSEGLTPTELVEQLKAVHGAQYVLLAGRGG